MVDFELDEFTEHVEIELLDEQEGLGLFQKIEKSRKSKRDPLFNAFR